MKAAAIAALVLAIAPAAAVAQSTYRAVGTEPFWSLTIDARTIRYDPADGRAVQVATPRKIATLRGTSYRTRLMTIDIVRQRCSDGMSDRTYPDTVRVQIGRQTLHGCGGGPLTEARDSVAGTWRIDMVDGRSVRLSSTPTLTFDGGRVSGRICNSFSGRYRLQRGTLTTQEVIGTQMACADGRMPIERTVWAALAKPLKVHSGSRDDTLVLSDGRSSLTLRRLR